jgi:hypothetical protein
VTDSHAEDSEPYSALSGQARRNIYENLPLEVAMAAMETIEGSIAVNPYRAGKPSTSRSTGPTRRVGAPTTSSTGSMRPSGMLRSIPSATGGTPTGHEPGQVWCPAASKP